MTAPIPVNEEARLEALYRLNMLDTPREEAFDCVTQLAIDALDAPIALVSLMDRDRQWFKSICGLDAYETPRDVAFCAHAILNHEPLIVEDATNDERFANNPLVIGEPGIRFYAGIPLLSQEGLALGTFCVVDTVPRKFSEKQLRILRQLGEMIRREIVSRELKLQVEQIAQENRRVVAESDARFRASFEEASVGIAIVDTDGRWLRVNRKLCEIVGYSEAELLQLHFQDITHPDDLDSDLDLVRQILAGEIQTYSLEKRYRRKDGDIVWTNLSVSLMHDADGRPTQFVSIIEDIDARKQAERALQNLRDELEQRVETRTEELKNANLMLTHSVQEQLKFQESLAASENQLRAVLENAQDAYISIDQDGLIAHWNRQAEITFGWSREEAIGRQLDETIIPVQFREAHRRGMKRFMHTGEAAVLDRRLELTALRRDGTLFPVEIRISPLPSETGHQFCAFLHDISARKQQQEALHNSQQQLQTIANNLPIQVAYVDADEIIRFINDAYRRDTGLTPELAVGKSLRQILKAPFYEGVAHHIVKVLAGERVTFETQTRFRGRDQIWGTVYIPDFHDGHVTGFFIMSQDITARKQRELSLLEQATRDQLTGLPNRAALLERLHVAAQRCHQTEQGLAVLFADLDGFKAINDQYGHDAGDAVLKQFAARLSAAVRSSDLVARLAGDEFVLVLEGLQPDCGAEEKVAEKILTSMQQPFTANRNEVYLGTSIGIYVHNENTIADPEQMLTFADTAMYGAKRGGKNQIRRYINDSALMFCALNI